jgi:CBS domain-containing protein
VKPMIQESTTLVHHLHPITSARLMTADLYTALRSAALLFAEPGIGLLVICDGDGKAAGVLSKSDLVRHLATSKSNEASVTALMSTPIVSCGPDDGLHSVWQMMMERSLQNIPVLDAGAKPVGILDIRDALKALLEQEEIQEHMLTDYIAGIGYR